MQYILTEQEFNQGYELLESWREYDIPIGEVYDKSKKLNNQGWFTDLSLYQDPVIDSGTDYDNQLTIDKMQDNLDFAKEHAQQCMDDGIYVSATVWQNEAHEIQNDMNDVMNNDI